MSTTTTEPVATAPEPASPKPAAEEQLPGAELLGDPGKKALDTMKADRNQARSEAAALKAQLAEMQAKIEGREAAYAAELEAQKVKDEALAAANARILKAEVRAAAASKLADPADALLYIDLDGFTVGANGEVDSSAIAAAVDDLIRSKPYLAAQGGAVITSPTSAREGSPRAQWAKSDLAGKTPEQIAAAKAEGLLNELLGIKS